jgi:hypothetical protein
LEKEARRLLGLEIFILVASLVFSALFLADTYDAEDVATGLLPNIIAAISILFCLSLFAARILSVKRKKLSKAVKEDEEGPQVPESRDEGLLAWWASYLGMAGYFLLILLVGLLWATFIYTLVIPFLMHYRKWKVVVLTSVGVTTCMYVAFCVILRMNLPTGILF